MNQSTPSQCDVLIVGAGPVGLFAALELNRHGLSCRIIDKKEGLSEHSKALGLQIRTLELFKDCGLFQTVVQQGHKCLGMEIKSNGKAIANLDFEQVDAPFHFLMMLPQSQTERIIHDALLVKEIHVEWLSELLSFEQTNEQVIAKIRNQTGEEDIRASWLIACDGAHSTVRHALNLEFVGAAYAERFWIADVHVRWQRSEDKIIAYLSDHGPLVFFPMGNHRYRIGTMALQDKETPTLDDFKTLIKACGENLPELYDAVWISSFNIHHRQIKRYVNNRIFLAGDASHIHSPLGGQGLNTGVQDIYNLVWKLALVHKGQAKKELLESYQSERFAAGEKVLHDTDKFTKLITLKNPMAITIRNKMMSALTSMPIIRKKIMSKMSEIDISYNASQIVSQDGFMGVSAGDLMPNVSIRTAGGIKNSFELFQSTRHEIVLFSGIHNKDITPLSVLAESLLNKYDDLIHCHILLADDAKLDWPGSIWFDDENKVRSRLKIRRSALMIIRPDKYIAYLANPISEEHLFDYLNNLFC